jgi:hypothetical protein
MFGLFDFKKPTYDEYVYLKIVPSSMVKPNINMKNYEAVQAAYN